MSRRHAFIIVAEFPDDVTEEQLSNVLADAVVQIAEPILERPDDGNDVEGESVVLSAATLRIS